MKKIVSLLFILVLTCCEVKVEPRKVNAQHIYNGSSNGTTVTAFNKDGIDYLVFTVINGTRNGGSDVYVINHTKELLEIEKLKLEIEELKSTTILN